MTESKKNVEKPTAQLGPEICSNVLMLYLDVTLPPIFMHSALKQFKSSSRFREQARMFSTESATSEEVCVAGEEALVILYNGSLGESLDSLRYKLFCEKVSTGNSYIHP